MQESEGDLLDDADGPVDDSKREGANSKTNKSIENSLFGFFEFAGVAGGSHILNTTDNDKNYSNDAGDGNNRVKNTSNNSAELVFAVFFATGSFPCDATFFKG